MKSELIVSSRTEWRNWLLEHHSEAAEVWLVYYKKHVKKPTISYANSVDEALCFGWIDGIKRRIDDEKYSHRFTPRRKSSKWSELNIERARKMIAAGKMSKAGLAAFNQRVNYDNQQAQSANTAPPVLTPEIEKALQANPAAWDNYNNLAPGYRKQYCIWLLNAKKPETLSKRLSEALELLQENKKLGMK